MTITSHTIEPEIDDEGSYFICPGCEGRNKLVSVGDDGDEGHIELTQPDV
jgi:hypothetical protein